MSSIAPIAEPDIVEAWVTGWAVSRGVAPPIPIMGGFSVEVGLPRQRARYVFPSIAREDLRRLALEITDPWVFLKVCVPSATLETIWPPGWVVWPDGFLMTTDLAPSAPVALLPGYELSVSEDRAIVATVTSEAGLPVASGKVALAKGYATFDQIGTDENHRRLGLGRAIMAALSNAALDRGTQRAVLVATPVGRELYETVGWRLHAHFTTAVIPGEVE